MAESPAIVHAPESAGEPRFRSRPTGEPQLCLPRTNVLLTLDGELKAFV